MTTDKTQKQWVIKGTEKDLAQLEFSTNAAIPKVGETDVLIRLHAASLNYRDLMIRRGDYPFALRFPVVPASDGAGEVVEVGPRVTRWKKGDRVVTLFNQDHQYGDIDVRASVSGVGGTVDGTLRQWAVFPETGLVAAPKNLTYLEAATLPCAALTSWNALYGLRPVKPGQTVLVQGTGGVSLFALQFAKAAGATVIATTSSAQKAETLKQLGADHVINYREDPNWGETAKALTREGHGVDHVVEVGGQATFEQSFKAVRFEGVITVIGYVGGSEGAPSVLDALKNICTVRGVYVGPKSMMEDMVAAIEANNIHPVVDKTIFGLEQGVEAYQYLSEAKHFGKVAIKID